jgi:hypothetical protein
MEKKHPNNKARIKGMGATEPLQTLIKQRLQPHDEASEALLLLLIRRWLF